MFWTVNGQEARLTSSMMAAASGESILAIKAMTSIAETRLIKIVT